jgi:cobyric acid synthase
VSAARRDKLRFEIKEITVNKIAQPARLTEDDIAELEEMIGFATQGNFHWGTHFSGSHEDSAKWFQGCLEHNAATDLQMVVVGEPRVKGASQVVALTGNGERAMRNAYLIAALLTTAAGMIAEIKEHRATLASLQGSRAA